MQYKPFHKGRYKVSTYGIQEMFTHFPGGVYFKEPLDPTPVFDWLAKYGVPRDFFSGDIELKISSIGEIIEGNLANSGIEPFRDQFVLEPFGDIRVFYDGRSISFLIQQQGKNKGCVIFDVKWNICEIWSYRETGEYPNYYPDYYPLLFLAGLTGNLGGIVVEMIKKHVGGSFTIPSRYRTFLSAKGEVNFKKGQQGNQTKAEQPKKEESQGRPSQQDPQKRPVGRPRVNTEDTTSTMESFKKIASNEVISHYLKDVGHGRLAFIGDQPAIQDFMNTSCRALIALYDCKVNSRKLDTWIGRAILDYVKAGKDFKIELDTRTAEFTFESFKVDVDDGTLAKFVPILSWCATNVAPCYSFTYVHEKGREQGAYVTLGRQSNAGKVKIDFVITGMFDKAIH